MSNYREVPADIGLRTIGGNLYMTTGAYQSYFEGLHQVVTAAAERQFHQQVKDEADGDKLMTMANNRQNINFFIDVMVFGQVESASSLLSEIVYIKADKDYSASTDEECREAIHSLLTKAKALFLETAEETVNDAANELNDPNINAAWKFVKGVIDGVQFGIKTPTELTQQG